MSKIESSDGTKQYITEALFLLMEHKVYEKISIVEITKKAGVGRVTYYRHFQSKDDILIQYFNREMMSNRKLFNFDTTTKEEYYEKIFMVLMKYKEKQQLMSLIQQANLEHIYLDFLNKTMVDNYLTHNRKETDYAPYYFAGCLFNICMEWSRRKCKDSVKTVTDAYFKCLFIKLD